MTQMSQWKQGKKILLGVSGGIAAYKAPDILRSWIKSGCEVETILTESAEQFVSPLVISTLTKRRCWLERDFLSNDEGWKIPHITLTDWCDLFIIAPCTANVLRQCAGGCSDTLMGAAMLACDKPMLLFPAMNSKMLENPATRGYIARLSEMGREVVDPDSGMLACGYEGKGRLPSNDVIDARVWRALYPRKDMAGLKVLATAGPTHEYIDPVRFIGNPSSGKMGFEIAKNAWYRGAEVTLVSGPTALTPPEGIRLVNVVSAEEMRKTCMDAAPDMDIIVKAAAVGDFRAARRESIKIKREKRDSMAIELVPNMDIAAELGKIKKPGQILVGFAAETNDLVANALQKMAAKNLDMIAVNDVLAEGAGFASDTNSVRILGADGLSLDAEGSKEDVAGALFDAVLKIRE